MKNGITKSAAKYIYGLAVILMVYHHLFCIPERIHCDYFSLLDTLFSFLNLSFSIEQRVAWFCKICVALFTFMSGYGLCRNFKQNVEENPEKFILISYLKIIKRYLNLILKSFLVLIVLLLPFKLFNHESINFGEFILNGLGINYTYIDEWWYLVFYVRILLIFPLINFIFSTNFKSNAKKYIYKFVSLVLVIFLFWFLIKEHVTYFIIFLEGYLTSRFRIFELIDIKLNKKNKTIISIILLAISIILRIIFSTDAAYNDIDILIIVPFVYSICALYFENRFMCSVFKFFGKHSTFIWLTHTIFAYHYLMHIITISKISTIIFLETILISLISSIVLSTFVNLIEYFKNKILEKIHIHKFSDGVDN